MTTTGVVIVDGDESVCRSFGRLLCGAGLQDTPFYSAETFLADLKCSQFGRLFLTTQHGGMSGMELAQWFVIGDLRASPLPQIGSKWLKSIRRIPRHINESPLALNHSIGAERHVARTVWPAHTRRTLRCFRIVKPLTPRIIPHCKESVPFERIGNETIRFD